MSLTKESGKSLLQIAQASIGHGLKHHQPLKVESLDYETELSEIKASFVTLEIGHNLRGCMGTVTAFRPLVSDVAYHAYAAAFSDPRFPRLQPDEFPRLNFHISILNEPELMSFESEEDLIQQLRPGIDGLILTEGGYRGTFLPSVWESLNEPHNFIRQLKKKAGLSPNHWSNTIKVQRYTTESVYSPQLDNRLRDTQAA